MLTAREQEALELARHVPAVLDRPYALAVDATRPDQQLLVPGASRRRCLASVELASLCSYGRKRVAALVRIRSDHDHLHRPFVWMSPAKRGSLQDHGARRA
jgi:hypothetical protein